MSLTPETVQAIRKLVRERPGALTISIAKQAGVSERDVFHALEGETAWALDPSRFKEIMTVLTQWGNVMIIVKNAYAVMESFGTLGGFEEGGGYFNVKSTGIDMHIKPEGIDAAYLVDKPAHTDGMPTHSVQFFDRIGNAIFKVFLTSSAGGRAPSDQALEAYRTLKNQFFLKTI